MVTQRKYAKWWERDFGTLRDGGAGMTDSDVRDPSPLPSPSAEETGADVGPFPSDEDAVRERFGRLADLSDGELLARLDLLGGIRRRVDARVIAYLAEVEERR